MYTFDEKDRVEATKYYDVIRSNDRRLCAIEGLARDDLRMKLGYESINVGSFALKLNINTSDLDLSIGVPEKDFLKVVDLAFRADLKFLRKADTRPGTIRYVFQKEYDGIIVDLAILLENDLWAFYKGVANCRLTMTKDERVALTYSKKVLKEGGNLLEYTKLKNAVYEEYCPGFIVNDSSGFVAS